MKSEWKNSKDYELGEVCSRLSSGKSISAKEILEFGKYPVYGGNGIRGYTDKKNFSGQCGIIGRQGAFCGNVRYFSGEAYMTEHAVVVCANEQNDTRYLVYMLSQLQLGRLSGQSAQPGLSVKVLAKQKIHLPDLETQKKIAKVLSALDDKIELNNQINKNLEEQANRIVKEYCQSVSSNVRLSKILSFVNGFAFQSKSYVANGRYRVITIKNVKDGEIDSNGAPFVDCLPISMKQECILGIGDVLVSLTGNVGRVGIVYESDLLLNQRVAKIVPYDMNLLPFLYFYFRMESTKISLETIAKGTAQQNLSTIETLKLELPYNDSIKEMSKRLKFLFETIVTNQRQNKVLSELRETLLPKLMSGEIDVDNVEI